MGWEFMSKKMTGASILWESLVREGVDVVFGYPGGAILPAYDAMLDFPIRHILVRHEQGATHMADGYARASGRVGVAVATSGPGATNMVTGIATAMLDSSPIVCITGQVGSKLIGSDAFQETDITGITLPITKHNYLVTRPDQVAQVIREAFYIARSGRPGPVLVDITKDAQQATCDFAVAGRSEAARVPAGASGARGLSCLDRRDRRAAAGATFRRRDAGLAENAAPGPFPRCRESHHDDRHVSQGRDRAGENRRHDGHHQRHRQGRRHDRARHGDDAVVRFHRCADRGAGLAGDPVGRGRSTRSTP